MSALPRVSVAVPVFNEEHVLPELLRRISDVVDELPGGPHEIVVVNDGSSDGTFDRLAQLAADDGRVVVVSLSLFIRRRSARLSITQQAMWSS